jgi:hypothetical protein
MNTEITKTELIETYKGIEIYKHSNPRLSSIYKVYVINGFQYSSPCIRLAKNSITRILNKAKKTK